MSEMTATTVATARGVLVEKTPLESYTPPAKPSLIGLSREELAACLAQAGVP
jgi:23S rRNA (adenine2503-C2)-methyltransferase